MKAINREDYNNKALALLNDLFEKELAPYFASKIKSSKIEKIAYSMGTFFAVIHGKWYSDRELAEMRGFKKEAAILNEIEYVCVDKDTFFTFHLDCETLINSLL